MQMMATMHVVACAGHRKPASQAHEVERPEDRIAAADTAVSHDFGFDVCDGTPQVVITCLIERAADAAKDLVNIATGSIAKLASDKWTVGITRTGSPYGLRARVGQAATQLLAEEARLIGFDVT